VVPNALPKVHMIVLQLAEDPAKQEHLEGEGEMQGFQVKNFP